MDAADSFKEKAQTESVKQYGYQPQSFVERFEDKDQLKKFVEYCFEPGTAANEKLKAVLADMLGGNQLKKKKGDAE